MIPVIVVRHTSHELSLMCQNLVYNDKFVVTATNPRIFSLCSYIRVLLCFLLFLLYFTYPGHEGVLWSCGGAGCFGGSQLIWVLNNEPILVSWFSILESGEECLTVVLVLHLSVLFGGVFFAFGFRSGTPAGGLMGLSFCPWSALGAFSTSLQLSIPSLIYLGLDTGKDVQVMQGIHSSQRTR
jgi:hypothetical protein